MIKTRYEFCEVHPSTEHKKENTMRLMRGQYEFAEINPDESVSSDYEIDMTSTKKLLTLKDTTECRADDITSSSLHVACSDSDYKNVASFQANKDDTIFGNTFSISEVMPLDTHVEGECRGDYSTIHVTDADHYRMYSHISINGMDTEENSHSYSHINTSDGKLSSGYFHLDTDKPQNVCKNEFSFPPRSGEKSSRNTASEGNYTTMKGYSHLDCTTQMQVPLTSNGTKQTTNKSLDVAVDASAQNEYIPRIRAATQAFTPSVEPVESKRGYSLLNVSEMEKWVAGPKELKTEGYSRLDITEVESMKDHQNELVSTKSVTESENIVTLNGYSRLDTTKIQTENTE